MDGGGSWEGHMQRWKGAPLGLRHHPSAQLIADVLIANASPGVTLAVAAHIDVCAMCGMAAAAAGGDMGRPGLGSVTTFQPEAEVGMGSRPEPLAGLQVGPWVTIRQGVEGALAPHASGLGECVYLLRAAPNAELGAASLGSAFVFLVTAGGVDIDGRRLSAGDFVEISAPPASVSADSMAGASLLIVADESPRRLRQGSAKR